MFGDHVNFTYLCPPHRKFRTDRGARAARPVRDEGGQSPGCRKTQNCRTVGLCQALSDNCRTVLSHIRISDTGRCVSELCLCGTIIPLSDAVGRCRTLSDAVGCHTLSDRRQASRLSCIHLETCSSCSNRLLWVNFWVTL